MSRFYIYPYKTASKSAKALARALGGRLIKLTNSQYSNKPSHVVINWGNSSSPYPSLNTANQCKVAANKLLFFNDMKEKGLEDLLPEFWTEAGSIPDEAFPVVCRTVLSGHSGAGIYIADTRDDLVHAPLYVKYVKKKEEYRIHVAGGEVISVQRKAKRVGVTPTCYQVRNLANGFVYVRDSIEPPVQCLESAVKVVQALELTFGAVDVIWNQHYQRAFVLEVNTAPGLEGRTVTDYATFFVENFS